MTTPPATRSSLLRAGFQREWQRMRSRPLYLLLLLVLPLVGWGILAATFDARMPRDMPVAVVDHDRSALSRQITRAIEATPSMHVAHMPLSPGEGESLLRQGDVYAVVWIDAGTERDLLRGDSPNIVVFYNAQWLLPANLIVKDLRAVFATLSAGVNIKRRMGGGESLYQAMRSSEPIRFELHALHNPEMDYTAFLLPALLATLLQIFVTLMTVHVIGTELKHGTAGDWLATNGHSLLRAMFTKLAPYALWYTALGSLLFWVTYGPLGVPFRGAPGLLFGGYALMTLAYMGVGLALISLTANLRLATSLASFITGPAFAFCGVSFPVIAMPLVAKIWALSLPLTHFIAVITQQGVAGYPAALSLPSLLWMALAAAFLIGISTLRLRSIAGNTDYWGRV